MRDLSDCDECLAFVRQNTTAFLAAMRALSRCIRESPIETGRLWLKLFHRKGHPDKATRDAQLKAWLEQKRTRKAAHWN